MGLPQYTTVELIANIKRRCAVPTSQLTYRDPEITIMADEQLKDIVVPLMMSTREEYFVDKYDQAYPSDGIIELPSFTVASKVRTVAFVIQQSPEILVNIPRIDLDVASGLGTPTYYSFNGFYVAGDKLHMYPNVNIPSGSPIRIFYYKRTLVLAAPNKFGRIVSIDPDTNTIVLSYVPSDWETGTIINGVSSIPQFKITNPAVTITAVSSPSIIVDTVEDLSVGDYLSMEGYSAIPQVPIECQDYLAQITAALLLEGQGDREASKFASDKAERLKENLLTILSQRIDGSIKKIINPNGGLRYGSGLGRWGRGWNGGGW